MPFKSFPLINFPIPCNWQQLFSLLKPTVKTKQWNLIENKHRRTMQIVHLVTTQSFKQGKSGWQNMETFAFTSAVRGYHVYQDLFTPSIGENLVVKREFNNAMDKQAVKGVRGDETVGQLPHKFSWIVWYFLARTCIREISVEVIGRRRCRRMEVPWQFEFNCSSKNETLERTTSTGEQESGLEPCWRF